MEITTALTVNPHHKSTVSTNAWRRATQLWKATPNSARLMAKPLQRSANYLSMPLDSKRDKCPMN